MIFHSWFVDSKINGLNVSADMTIEEYLHLARRIIWRNELQRKKVKSSGRVYELLRNDLLDGCVMPPLTLAVTEDFGRQIVTDITQAVTSRQVDEPQRKKFEEFVQRAVEAKELLILDGLQRTYTLLQCHTDAQSKDRLPGFLSKVIRVEIYLGLSKTGILYRMLTLNTGQIPMSFRHQLEILYQDHLDKEDLPEGIRVVREVDEGRARGSGVYKYSDVIDMFYAYSTGTPMSFDRQALVTQLKEIDFLESFSPEQDDFWPLLETYQTFVSRVTELSDNWQAPDNYPEGHEVVRPFGTTVLSILGRVQPMTSFGAECKRLVKHGQIESPASLSPIIQGCDFKTGEPDKALAELIVILDQIATTAKKIGQAQRAYFQLCFGALFNREADTYQDLSSCWLAGQEKYGMLYDL